MTFFWNVALKFPLTIETFWPRSQVHDLGAIQPFPIEQSSLIQRGEIIVLHAKP